MKFVVEGLCYDGGGGQDDDGFTRVEEKLECPSRKAAKLRFKQILDYHSGLRNRRDHSLVYQTIQLELKQEGKVLASVKLRYEKYFKQETSIYHKGRGWISESKWRKLKHKTRRYKDRAVITSSGSSLY